MNKFVMKPFMCFLLLISLISCSKDKTFVIEIANETDYTLDEVRILNGDDYPLLAIGPHQTSSTFEYVYTPHVANFFTEVFFYITIIQYSDSVKTYINEKESGGLLSMSKFREGRINTINIKPSTYPPNHPNPATIFSISVN